jgi:hypothetical protein
MSEQDQSALEHAWRYFALHAGQRISIFNFFLLVSGSIGAGLAACLQKGGAFDFVGCGLGALLMLVAFAFWKLDQRTAFLIKHAESAISAIEATMPVAGRLVSTEASATDAERGRQRGLARMWTYGQVFRVVYAAMGAVGLIAIAVFVGRIAGWW